MKSKYLIIILSSIIFTNAFAAEWIDPTKPLDSGYDDIYTSDTAVFKLFAIITTKTHKSVVINGKTLELGDKIKGFTITGISENKVVLSSDTKKIVLKLFKTANINAN